MAATQVQIEDALIKWLRESAGFRAQWGHQGNIRPPEPFCSIAFLTDQTLGGADQVKRTYDASRPALQQIEQRITTMLSVTFSIHVNTMDVIGESSAPRAARRIRSCLSKPSVLAYLAAVGLSPWDKGQLRNLTEILVTEYLSHVQFDVQFYASEEVVEYFARIKQVRGSVTLDGNAPIAFDTGPVT